MSRPSAWVYDNDTAENFYSTTGWLTFAPTASETKTFTSGVADHWNIAAAMGKSLRRQMAGVTDPTFIAYTQPCACVTPPDRSCLCSGKLYIDSYGVDRKYIISHELGHAVAYVRNGNASASKDYTADPDNCVTDTARSHEAASKEYQSAAANEGIAHYYAAAVWNDTTESDCGFYYYKSIDWDLVEGNDPQEVDCEDAPMSGLANANYLEDLCDKPWLDLGTEWDWLRFFWDLTTDEGVSTEHIFDLWDESNPDTWTSTANSDTADTGDPEVNMRYAADNHVPDLLKEWDAQAATNGIDH